jgi:3-oxoadipate CoA-transferase beta subunit
MTQQLNPRQIAWRVAQDLPRAAYVQLGCDMALLVPDYVANDSGMVFERGLAGHVPVPGEHRGEYYLLGAREVAENGDVVVDAPDEHALAHLGTAPSPQVFIMANYFRQDGRPTLVPECTAAPHAAGCATRLYTDIAVIDLHDGKAWLREIGEGLTLLVLQAETDVELHVAPDLRLLKAPALG